MQIECIDNGGFEDLLTIGRTYPVEALQGYSAQLLDDSGQLRWFGRSKFAPPLCQSCSHEQAA